MNKEILCKCLLECKDEILVFTNFTSLVLISTMIARLVILFIIRLYARNNTFKYNYLKSKIIWKKILLKNMVEETVSQEFRLKNIDEERNYLIEEIKQNELLNKNHKKVCLTLNYI